MDHMTVFNVPACPQTGMKTTQILHQKHCKMVYIIVGNPRVILIDSLYHHPWVKLV